MANLEEWATKKLEAQIARAQARLDEERPGSPINFLSGLALGTVAGALLAFFFTREEELPEELSPRENEPILLRNSTPATEATSTTPRPLAAMPSAPEEGVTDQLAAAELESPEAVKEIAREGGEATSAQATDTTTGRPVGTAADRDEVTPDRSTGATTGGRVEPVDGTCPASHPIKGNKSSMGALIYHTTASASYERTRPEACFATEADAEAAGYRAPRG